MAGGRADVDDLEQARSRRAGAVMRCRRVISTALSPAIGPALKSPDSRSNRACLIGRGDSLAAVGVSANKAVSAHVLRGATKGIPSDFSRSECEAEGI